MTESGFKEKVGKKDMDCLDISKKLNQSKQEDSIDKKFKQTYLDDAGDKIEGFYDSDESSEEE